MRMTTQANNQLALVSGATSGIGEAYARRLAAMGFDLIITGRRNDLLQKLADELSQSCQVKVEVFVGDLAEPRVVDSLVQKIQHVGIDMLINNAGFGLNELFSKSNLIEHERMIAVHVLCPVKLTHAVLPTMLEKNRGTIINVASISDSLLIPKNSTYSGTKSFLKTFSQALCLELEGTGVRIQALCPGLTRTDLHERMGLSKTRQKNRFLFRWMNPEQVVEASFKDLHKGKVICIPGRSNRLLVWITRIIPWTLYKSLILKAMKVNKG